MFAIFRRQVEKMQVMLKVETKLGLVSRKRVFHLDFAFEKQKRGCHRAIKIYFFGLNF